MLAAAPCYAQVDGNHKIPPSPLLGRQPFSLGSAAIPRFSTMADEGRRSAGLSKSCILIIVVASVERFAYKGVASNLVTYLTDVMKLGTAAAAKSVNNWCGVTSLLPLLGAFLADSCWDRYSTILGSSLLYVGGLVALTSWALLSAWMPAFSLFLPLYLISLGQGGYNPSLQAFGADQLDIEDDLNGKNEEGKRKKSLFFQWWYFGICSGSLLGNSIMSYIQDNYGWELGFAIPAVAMAGSVACFTAGTRCYVRNDNGAGGRRMGDVIRAIKQAVVNRVELRSGALKLPPKEDDVDELELQVRPLCKDSDCSETLAESEKKVDGQEQPPSVAKTLLKVLPIWALLLMFAVIFQLPSTFFTRQGAAMKRDIGGFFTVPPATLQSSITISIILLMPLYDRLIVPVIRVVTRRDKGINVLQRMGVGMLLSIVAMGVAAVVEVRRARAADRGGGLSILWLLPQYVLLGVSDVFTVVGMQEFFYTRVPPGMRTVGIGLYLSVFGVGSFLSSALISVVEMVTSAGGGRGWIADDMEEARLDKYYWFLALLATVSFLVFMFLCRSYDDDRVDSAEVKA
uniref:Putative peptide/nitrate transporter At5g14940 n=1 Tax=Anthurium amnicola TaxID=1678845 RepID=A0A1D1Y8S2_9ARAE